jgi:hypothetical protein
MSVRIKALAGLAFVIQLGAAQWVQADEPLLYCITAATPADS